MDFGEFEAAVRGDCNINEDVVSQADLGELFSAVDKDGSGDIDIDEFVEFLASNPLAQDMSFKVFSEAMFQLAQLWVGKDDEVQFAKFLDTVFKNITTADADGNAQLNDIVIEGGNYRLAPIESVGALYDDSGRVDIEGVEVIQNNIDEEEPEPEPVKEPEPEPEPEQPAYIAARAKARFHLSQGQGLAEGKRWGAAVSEYELGLAVEGIESEYDAVADELTAELEQARADALSQRDALRAEAQGFLETGAAELAKERFSEAISAIDLGLAVEFTEDEGLTEALVILT